MDDEDDRLKESEVGASDSLADGDVDESDELGADRAQDGDDDDA